jgi:uncharacterized protein YkwD
VPRRWDLGILAKVACIAGHFAERERALLHRHPNDGELTMKTQTTIHASSFAHRFALVCALHAAYAVLVSAAQAQTTSPCERSVWGSSGHWQRYALEIPAGTGSLSVVVSGGTGNADLYLRFAEQPSESAYDCRPFEIGAAETCIVASPAAGTWHIGIRGASEFAEVGVHATWGPATAAPATPLDPTPVSNTPADPTPAPNTPIDLAPAPSTPADPAATPPAAAPDWKQAIVDRHNLYRAQHCSVDLRWDEEIAATAQEWANRCIWDHDSTSPYGENIAYRASNESALSPIDSWYGEVANYDFAAPGFSATSSHFTQVVWNASTRIGCARAACPFTAFGQPAEWGTAHFYVCRYAERGNLTGSYPENVKPKSDGGVCE